MGLSFIGSYSGIDQATIDQLMEAERIPLKQLERKQTSIKGKMDAWKDVNTRLNSLFKKMEALKDASTFNTKVAKSSDDSYVSMTAGTNAIEGKYNINVEKLATNTSLVGDRVEGGKVSGGGSFTINGLSEDDRNEKVENDLFTKYLKDNEYKIDKDGKILNKDSEVVFESKDELKGTTEFKKYFSDNEAEVNASYIAERTIEIGENENISSIAKKINEKTKDTGVIANVVDGKLVLDNKETGTIGMKLEGDVLSELGFDVGGKIEIRYDEKGKMEVDSGNVDYKVDDNVIAGEKAKFTVNGIRIERDTNTISDAIEGVTINLDKVHAPGELDTITVSSDTEKAAQAMQDFVDQYNSTMQFIEEKTKAGDPEVPGSKGVLAGESSLIRLQTSLRQLVTGSLEVSGSDITDISQIGISTTDRYGALSFDKEKFLEELAKDKDSVMNFLDPKVEGEVGFVARANDYIDSFISTKDGLIKSQNESFEKSLKDLDRRIENFEERMVKKEAYYIRKFTALDIAMMKAESQMSWLQGQVDAMNAK